TNSSDSPLFTILDSGNVGIGTTSPGAKLHAYSSSDVAMILETSSATNDSQLSLRNGDGSANLHLNDDGTFYVWDNIVNSDLILRVNNGANIDALTVDGATGNVGIGSTSPNARLSVKGAGSTTGINFQTTNSSDSPLFTILDSGNVGIGITSPVHKLSVDAGNIFLTNSSANPFYYIGEDSIGAGGTFGYMTWDRTNDLLQLGSSSGGPTFTLTESGAIGIGTTTPVSTLSVQGSLCVRDTGSCGTTAGTIYATTAAVTDIDLAENYPTTDSSLKAGEIVMFDNTTDNTAFIKRADKSTGGTIMGIISTAPGLLLGRSLPNITKPVALSGRVPLLVNNEGGSIAIGDRIALSSIAGVGMKAPLSGETVAIALEPFDASRGSGKIEVFVNLRDNVDLSPLELASKKIEELNLRIDLMATSTIDTINSTVSTSVASFFASIKEWVGDKITVVTGYFKEIFADKVNTKELCIDEVCINKSQLQALLSASSTPTVTATPTPSPTEIIIIPTITPTPSYTSTPTPIETAVATSTPVIIETIDDINSTTTVEVIVNTPTEDVIVPSETPTPIPTIEPTPVPEVPVIEPVAPAPDEAPLP
ncbi:MAG: hypothetical protein AAB683_00415, partial [Patescibacteria group bacterium]